MKMKFKFSVVMLCIMTTLLSGCFFPGEGWRHGGDEHHGGERGGDRGGDRHHDRGD